MTPVPQNCTCYLIPVSIHDGYTIRILLWLWNCFSGSNKCAPATYDWNAPNQMWGFWLFKCQFTSWKKICQIISDEVDYLLSILGREGYAAMDHRMPTDPADKNDDGKFLDYLESTLDDEMSPMWESMSWRMSRRGQMRQLRQLLIIYTNLLAVY